MKERKILAVNNFQVVISTLTHEGRLHDHGHSAGLEQTVEIRRKHGTMLDPIARHHSGERKCGHHGDRLSSGHRVDGNSAPNGMVILDLFRKQVNIKTYDLINQDLYWANSRPTFNQRALIIIHAEQGQRLRQRSTPHRLSKYLSTASTKFVGGVSNTGDSK
jgi:hypothetical protein